MKPFLTSRGCWPDRAPWRVVGQAFRDLAAAMAEAEREAQAKTMSQLRERLMLRPADHRDWLTAMSWFAALNRQSCATLESRFSA